MEEESTRLWLGTPDGEEKEYELYGVFAIEEKEYMALRPIEDAGDDQIVLIGYHEGPGDEVILAPIEDEEEYEEAGRTFEFLFNGEAQVLTEYPEGWNDPEDFKEQPAWKETEDLRRQEESLDDEEYCYEDAQGRLFLYGSQGEKIFLDEWGNPIEEAVKEREE